MKKLLSFSIVLSLILMLCVPALSYTPPTLTYDLSCSGSELKSGTNEVVVHTGDVITVSYKLLASESTSVSVTQNEIYYDHSFFELVPGSNKTSTGYSDYVTSLQTRLDGKRYVYFNTLVTHTHTAAPAEIGTFQLKVIGNSGESTVANVNNKASDSNAEPYGATAVNLHVSIDNPQPQKFTVTYAASGGTVSPTEQTVDAGTAVTLPVPTKLYYNFAYWSISGDSTQYPGGQSYKPASDVTFTAVWTAVPTPAAPTGLTGVSASSASATDGKITGTTAAMEYSTSSGFETAYNCSAGVTTGLRAGTYFVRIKAVGNTPAGTYTAVVVSAPPPPGGGSGGGDTDACDGGDGCPSKHFFDIDTGAWYHEAVDYVLLNGLMNGMDADTFGTNLPTLRGQIVTILYRLEGEPEVTGGNIFKDVEDAAYYTNAIIWATENNIANGYGDGSFGKLDPITREQLAAILWRYAVYKGYDLSSMADLSGFVDADNIHPWATDAMSWANSNELITGLPGSILDPQNNAIRVQAAAILMRFIENVMGQSGAAA